MLVGWTKTVAAAAVAAAVAGCGGGGGGAAVVPEAVVTAVSAPTVLESTGELQFAVALDKAAVNTIRVQYSTVSTAKAGGGGTGSAVGGAACAAGIDIVAASNQELVIPAGSAGGTIRVPVCTNTTFGPNKTVLLAWSLSGASGSALGTILNDDAGGLNGTGVAGTFGRDSEPLTSAAADGRLGFSFQNVANAAPAGGNCVRDNVTGLLWEPKTGAALHDPAAIFAWGSAALTTHIANVNAANTCGFADWRLPTPEELASLVDNGQAVTPTLDGAWFTNQAAAQYWTSTEYRDGTATNAWFVDFNTGTVSSGIKTAAYRARLVTRGGTVAPAALPASCADASRYSNHGDGTVTDNRTGLMWKQCAEGQSGAACAGGAAVAIEWAAALAQPATANGNSDLGYTDWRLPTRAELSSIAEREQCDALGVVPSVIATVFPNTGIADYWTQTPDAFNAAQAWRVNFRDGEVAPAAKTGVAASKRVRLVRAGQ